MAQDIFPDINPLTTSGNQLAALLNDFKEAIMTGLSGTSRPAELLAGGTWVDTTNDGAGTWDLKIYTGTADITLLTIDKNSGQASAPGALSSFDILKNSDDSIGPLLNLLKKRIAGGGQTLSGDILGEINFVGHTNTAVEQIQARITSSSTDNVSPTVKGAYLAFEVTPTGTSTLSERMRLANNGRLGVGVTAPLRTGHFVSAGATSGIMADKASDDANSSELAVRKRRVASSGQVLNNDSVGRVGYYSTDDGGAEIEVARIEAVAAQDHTSAAMGSKLQLKVKGNGETTFQTIAEITKDSFQILGVELVGNFTKNNFIATTGPSVSDDTSEGYINGSRWLNTTNGAYYILVDDTVDAALWTRIDTPSKMITFANDAAYEAVYGTGNGYYYYNTTDHTMRMYVNGEWREMATFE